MAINKGIVGIGDASSTPVVARDNFNPITYNGNSTNDFSTALTQSIDTVDFQPDLVWIKSRNQAYSHMIFDSVRGATNAINSDTTAAQSGSAGFLKSFDTEGFGLGGDFSVNRGGYPFISWNWKAGGAPTATNSAGAGNVPTSGSVMIDGVASTAALAGTIAATKISANTAAGFSIVQYTGTGSLATVGHGLNQPVELILVKNTSASASWAVYSAPTGINKFLELNSAGGTTSYSNYWGAATPTNNVFGVVSGNFNNNATNASLIAYCFHSVDGYSKIGTYEGNGSSSGQTITGLGFDPTFVMQKAVDSSAAWRITDSARGDNRFIYASLNTVYPNDVGSYTSLITDGFKLNSLDSNQGGQTFIYMAFA